MDLLVHMCLSPDRVAPTSQHVVCCPLRRHSTRYKVGRRVGMVWINYPASRASAGLRHLRDIVLARDPPSRHGNPGMRDAVQGVEVPVVHDLHITTKIRAGWQFGPSYALDDYLIPV